MRAHPTKRRAKEKEEQKKNCRLPFAISKYTELKQLDLSLRGECTQLISDIVMFSCGEEEDPQKHVLPLFPLPSLPLLPSV